MPQFNAAGGGDDPAPSIGDGSIATRSAILAKIRAHTRRAPSPGQWCFKKTPWVRQLKDAPSELLKALRADFSDDLLLTAHVAVHSPGGDLQLSPVFGQPTSKFVILCDAAGKPVDAISSRGALSTPHPHFLGYSPARHSYFLTLPSVVVVAVTDDDMHVLHRLGIEFTSAAGFDTLEEQHSYELFEKRHNPDRQYSCKYRLTIPAWQIGSLREGLCARTQLILEHLEKLGNLPELDVSQFVNAWIPTKSELNDIRSRIKLRATAELGEQFSSSLKSSRCTVVECLRFIRDQTDVNFSIARQRLTKAVDGSKIIPLAAETKAALAQFRRAFKADISDKFDATAADANNGFETLRQQMGRSLAELWFEDQPIIAAAKSVMAGEYPRELLKIDPQKLTELLRLSDSFARLYRAPQPPRKRGMRTTKTKRRSQSVSND